MDVWEACRAHRERLCVCLLIPMSSPQTEAFEPHFGDEGSEAKKRRGFPRLIARRQQSQEANLGLFSLISEFATSC